MKENKYRQKGTTLRKSLNFCKVFIQSIHIVNEKASPLPSLLNFGEPS